MQMANFYKKENACVPADNGEMKKVTLVGLKALEYEFNNVQADIDKGDAKTLEDLKPWKHFAFALPMKKKVVFDGWVEMETRLT